MPRLDTKGSRASRTVDPVEAELEHAAVGRAGRLGDDVDAPQRQQRGDGPQSPGVVVIAGDDGHVGAGAGQREERLVDDLLGVRWGGGRVEQVPGYDDQVDGVLPGDRRDLGQYQAVLVGAVGAAQTLADMPVRRVQQLHRALRRTWDMRPTLRRGCDADRAAPREGGPVEDAGTLGVLLGGWAADSPADAVAIERHGLRRRLTVGELVAGVDRRAAGLAARGAGPDRAVVAWLPNRLEWLEVLAAAARVGAPVVGLNTRYRSEELRHVLDRSRAAVLVAVDEFAGTRFAGIVAAADVGPDLSIVVVGPRGPGWSGITAPVTDWDALDVEGSVDHRPAPSDLAIAFTTSGTTGLPKLAVHDQAGVVRHAVRDAAAFDVRAGDRLLLDLPICGTFGFSSLLAAVAGRATTLIDERFVPDDSAAAIAGEAVTHYHASDDMILRVTRHRARARRWALLAGGRLRQLRQRRPHRRRARRARARRPPHRSLRHVRGVRPARPVARVDAHRPAIPRRRDPGRRRHRGAGDRPGHGRPPRRRSRR